MTHPDKQAALELANRIGTDVTAGLSYEEILSRNPRAVYELAKAVIVQAAELERVTEAIEVGSVEYLKTSPVAGDSEFFRGMVAMRNWFSALKKAE